MAYVPDWERLTDALTRVCAATGLSKQGARRDICAATGDGTIKVRLWPELIKKTIVDHQMHHGYARKIAEFQDNVYSGINRYPEPWELHRPFPEPLKGLKPRDLNWRESRFEKPHSIPTSPDTAPMLWDVSIELFSADVTRVLIAPQTGARGPSEGESGKRLQPATRRSAKREQVRIVLDEIYPSGIPNQDNEPNPVVVDKVVALIAKRFGNRFPVSKETILRTAGRLKVPKGRSRHG